MVKKRALINSLLTISIILAGVGLGYGLSRMATSRRKAAIARSFMPATGQVAKDTRPLRERAKQAGRYVTQQAPKRSAVFADLAGLSDSSSAVIVGIPEDNISTLSTDGKNITIDYRVKVMYVYKGALREGETITVSLPGGMMAFEDGSTAEVRTPWFRKMMNGKAYALFLTATSNSGQFVTTGEAQGLFEIPMTLKDSMIIQTHSGLPGDPISKYSTMDARDFLRELRRVTKKPLKSKA
jgi:hypothetical protein